MTNKSQGISALTEVDSRNNMISFLISDIEWVLQSIG